MLSGEVGGLTEQLCIRDGEGTGVVSDVHGVVQPGTTGGRRHQVAPLKHVKTILK